MNCRPMMASSAQIGTKRSEWHPRIRGSPTADVSADESATANRIVNRFNCYETHVLEIVQSRHDHISVSALAS